MDAPLLTTKVLPFMLSEIMMGAEASDRTVMMWPGVPSVSAGTDGISLGVAGTVAAAAAAEEGVCQRTPP